jgi:hypothetical protein
MKKIILILAFLVVGYGIYGYLTSAGALLAVQ